MALLEIIQAPDPRLTTPCAPVETFGGELDRLLDDMFETMYAAPGIGLAAPQIGVLQRFFVADLGEEDKREPLAIFNPEIVERSATRSVYEEGCLSLPKQFADVRRADRIKIRYQDRQGEPRELEAGDLLGRCIQHEIDHLNGVLYIDHISALKRTMILRRLAKSRRR
jgi:peptide deformylase